MMKSGTSLKPNDNKGLPQKQVHVGVPAQDGKLKSALANKAVSKKLSTTWGSEYGGSNRSSLASLKSGPSTKSITVPQKITPGPSPNPSTQGQRAKGQTAQVSDRPRAAGNLGSDDKGTVEKARIHLPSFSITTPITREGNQMQRNSKDQEHGSSQAFPSAFERNRLNRVSIKPLRSGVGEISLLAQTHSHDTHSVTGPSINPVRYSVAQTGNAKTEDFIVHYFRATDAKKTIDSRHEEFYKNHGFPTKPKYYPKSRRFSDTSETDPDFDLPLFDSIRETLNSRQSFHTSDTESMGSAEHVNRRRHRHGHRSRVHPETRSSDPGHDCEGCNEKECWRNLKECFKYGAK